MNRDNDFDTDLDHEDADGPLPGLVTGVCRKCEAEIRDVTPEEGQRWQDKHVTTCPNRDLPPIW